MGNEESAFFQMMKETDASKKKQLGKMMKMLEEKIKTSKEELESLSERILAKKEVKKESEGEEEVEEVKTEIELDEEALLAPVSSHVTSEILVIASPSQCPKM